MTQQTFRRGIERGFVEALNALYDQPESWWRKLVDDKELFLAIREDSVNVYHRGCSLLRLRPQAEGVGVVGKIHYKYLLRPHLTASEYVEVVEGTVSLPKVEEAFTKSISETEALKKASEPYAGPEQAGVHDVVLANWNIVDVEIAFPTDSADESKSSAPRVDFAALREGDRDIELVFFEAKHFTNSELRKRGDDAPDVIGQIEKYSDLLREQHDQIADTYLRVCCNLLNLRGFDERHPQRHELLKSIVNGSKPLKVNTEPRLVVFGFDADQRAGKKWKRHRDKLKNRLGKRVLCRGSPKGFTRGIST